jgi:integrase
MEMGYAESNPFSTFKRKSTHVRRTVWTQEQVIQFLDVAYSDFKYRNVGLIVQMAYEWCQRIGDMRLLQFSSIDFDKSVLNLQQSKRRSVVHLPISLDLLEMLVQQKEEYGFQPYVTPHYRPVRGEYKPYTLVRLSKVGRRLMDMANLPSELRMMDLRRTGTTEMVEAGVPMGQIMSVTGHANPQSVKPYMKNTYESANNALTLRKTHGISK